MAPVPSGTGEQQCCIMASLPEFLVGSKLVRDVFAWIDCTDKNEIRTSASPLLPYRGGLLLGDGEEVFCGRIANYPYFIGIDAIDLCDGRSAGISGNVQN